MKELSLHILDLVENSIDAQASIIKIKIIEDTVEDYLTISIDDNGMGMDETFVKKAVDPFVTTRKTRKVGMGLALMKAAALRCEGSFHIQSKRGMGTDIECKFRHSHIDRAPLGDMGQTILSIINYNEKINIYYEHRLNQQGFGFNTEEVNEILDGVTIKTPDVLLWIKDYINDNIRKLYSNK